MSLRKLFYIYLLLLIIAAFYSHTTIKSAQVDNLDGGIRLDYLIYHCLYLLPDMIFIRTGLDCRLGESPLL